MVQRHALEVFLDERYAGQSVVGDLPVREETLQSREGREGNPLRILSGISRQEGRNEHIGRVATD